MNKYYLKDLSDAAVAHQLPVAARRTRAATAVELAYIAEFADRKLYLPAAHPSMVSYCIHVLGYSRDSARKRIHAARSALQYPAIFDAVENGRLNLTGVLMVAPYLGRGDAALLEAVSGKTCEEIAEFLARRFPSADQPMLPPVDDAARLDEVSKELDEASTETSECAARRVQNETVGPSVLPVAEPPARAPWPVSVDPADHEKLRHAQSLLRHQIPNGDLTRVLSRLIDLGLAQLEKQRSGTGRQSRQPSRPSSNPRHIPSAVKAQVWVRDGGRCTFESEDGHRCPSRDFLECDHIVPVARGGMATVENLRLRCRAHNQFEAERTFGADFMRNKRGVARAASPGKTKAEETSIPRAVAEVIPWLRGLGFKIAEANAAASLCENMASEPLEKRVRVALSYFRRSRANGTSLVT